MGRTVAFHRKQRGTVRLRGRDQLFELQVGLAKEVEPESGMTVNLIEVDAGMAGLWRHLNGRDFAETRELLSVARVFLSDDFRKAGAELIEVEWTDLWSGLTALWNHAAPDQALTLIRRKVRVQFSESGRFRLGEACFKVPWETAAPNPDGIELSVRDEDDMIDRLVALDGGAREVFFQDAFTRESWRKIK